MAYKELIKKLPYSDPFLFVDELLHVDKNGATGSYTFNADLEFYKGHFINNPVTPGVILTECCAQIGLVCLGIYLLQEEASSPKEKLTIGFTSSKMSFLQPVFPGEKVTVISKKVYFRFNKLRCEVKMHNQKEKVVCKGTLDGMIISGKNE
jgi:3-hydroxyacyl-[acyl-carrier-protein] dehydratase